jgi:Ni,Fe-hydrogenase III component G
MSDVSRSFFGKEELEKRFPEAKITERSPRRVYVEVDRAKISEVATFLFKEHGARFAIATGTDTRRGFEILYHFAHDAGGVMYSVRIFVPKEDPKVTSLGSWLPAARWIEREMHELLGIDFEGHPNLKPLLTAEDWPRDRHPLRRGE